MIFQAGVNEGFQGNINVYLKAALLSDLILEMLVGSGISALTNLSTMLSMVMDKSLEN